MFIYVERDAACSTSKSYVSTPPLPTPNKKKKKKENNKTYPFLSNFLKAGKGAIGSSTCNKPYV